MHYQGRKNELQKFLQTAPRAVVSTQTTLPPWHIWFLRFFVIFVAILLFTSFRWEKDKEGLERNILVAVDDRPRYTQLLVGKHGPTSSSKPPPKPKPEPIKSESNDHLASMHLDSDNDVAPQLNPKGTVEELFAAQRPHLLKAAKKIPHDMILLLHVNNGFTPFVKSWLCNVKIWPKVIESLLIINDKEGKKALDEFMPGLNIIVYETFIGQVGFGDVGYWRMNQHRIKILNLFLEENIHAFLIEADAFWVSNALDDPNLTKKDVDLVLFHDEQFVGFGFMGMVPTQKTKDVFRWLMNDYDRSLLKHRNHGNDFKDLGMRQEQFILTDIVHEDLQIKPGRRNEIKNIWLDSCLYASGLWYDKHDRSSAPLDKHQKFRARCKGVDPIVINNNWIMGSPRKIDFAKSVNHWFIKDDGTCVDINAYLKEFRTILDARRKKDLE